MEVILLNLLKLRLIKYTCCMVFIQQMCHITNMILESKVNVKYTKIIKPLICDWGSI